MSRLWVVSVGLLLASGLSTAQVAQRDAQSVGAAPAVVEQRAALPQALPQGSHQDSPQKKMPPADVPSDHGIIAVPPKTGPAAIKTPPENLDPDLDDATKDIDEQNRLKAQRQRQYQRLRPP